MLNMIKKLFFEKYISFYEPTYDIAHDFANDEHPSNLNLKMFNFDSIAASIYHLKKELIPCSPDGLYIDKKLYFIEFKNGRLDTQEKKRNLRLKFVEGPYVILARILRENNLFINRKDFHSIPKVAIVVYNHSKNPSDILSNRYGARFQLDEYSYLLYDKVFAFNFKQFNKLVREHKYPFDFLKYQENMD